MNYYHLLVYLLLSYLGGTLNPAWFIAHIKGFDIRKTGSGNAGGSNALITMGGKIGLFCMLFDVFKAFFIVRLALWMFSGIVYAGAASAVCCILGHIFPFYMGFKGGKGLACIGGSAMALTPIIFFVLFGVALLVSFVLDYICYVPTGAVIVYPVIYGLFTGSVLCGLVFLPVTLVVLMKHRENFQRIKDGTEAHFSFIWKRNEEMERLTGGEDADMDVEIQK